MRFPIEDLDQAKEDVAKADARFDRFWCFVVLSILAWAAFWEHADRHADNPQAQLLAWTAVVIAVMVAYTL